MKRTDLQTRATANGYELSKANFMDHMDAANRAEPKPRWTLNPVGNIWSDKVKRCGTLAQVATEIDRLENAQA
jgi:hypothetical protein